MEGIPIPRGERNFSIETEATASTIAPEITPCDWYNGQYDLEKHPGEKGSSSTIEEDHPTPTFIASIYKEGITTIENKNGSPYSSEKFSNTRWSGTEAIPMLNAHEKSPTATEAIPTIDKM